MKKKKVNNIKSSEGCSEKEMNLLVHHENLLHEKEGIMIRKKNYKNGCDLKLLSIGSVK